MFLKIMTCSCYIQEFIKNDFPICINKVFGCCEEKEVKRTTIDSAGYDYDLFSPEKVTKKTKSVYAVSTDIGIQNTYVKLVGKTYSRSSLSMKRIEVDF